MSRRRLLLVVAFAIVAVAVSFGLHRELTGPSPGNETAESNPSTEPGTDRPVSRADSGQSKTVIEQSPDSSRNSETRPVQSLDGGTIVACHQALLGKKYIQERVDGNCGGIADGDVVGMQLCRRALESDYAYLQKLTAKAAGCPASLARASDYYEALRNAALTGNVNAQECYLNGDFSDPVHGDAISQAQLDDYLPLARRFIQDAIERGDWAIVHRLAEWPEDVQGYGLLVSAYPFGPGHPDTLYKMNYLLTLGARDRGSAELATNLVNSFRNNGELSAEQIQAGEVWARETYDRYFAATPYNKKIARSSFCETD
jgi:hypothetical protein